MKYAPEVLQTMAEIALQARESGDTRYHVLVTMLALRLGIPMPEVELQIVALAQGHV